jgi:hypothetical protein
VNGVVLLCHEDPYQIPVTEHRRSSDEVPVLPWQRRRRYPHRNVVIATFSAKRRMPSFPHLIQAIDDDDLKNFELYNSRPGVKS